MAAATAQGGLGGAPARVGRMRSIITLAETNQLKTGNGFISHVVVMNVGTTATIDIYDNATTTANKVFEWVSADGKGTFPIQMPVSAGIRVVYGGTPGACVVVWG